jgi:tRNA A58 N-methylase Trm61
MRAWIYNQAFAPLTVRWYRSVLEQLEPNTRMLDIGIGTARSLVANADLVCAKDIHVHGVDIDGDYVKVARKALAKAGLADRVTIDLESIYDHKAGPYDAAYFAASFMLMPDPPRALRHVSGLLKPGGRIYFTQTFQEKRSPLMEKLKPFLVHLTTIDFGHVTYEQEFLDVVQNGGLSVVENAILRQRGTQTFRLVVAEAKAA